MTRDEIERHTCVPADGHGILRLQAISIRDIDARLRAQAELLEEQSRQIEQLRSILQSRDRTRAAAGARG